MLASVVTGPNWCEGSIEILKSSHTRVKEISRCFNHKSKRNFQRDQAYKYVRQIEHTISCEKRQLVWIRKSLIKKKTYLI